GQRVLTMRTPGADEDLAVGFLLGEGVIRDGAAVAAIECAPGDPAARRPDTVRVTLGDPSRARLAGRLTRTHEIRSSCGICGLADADHLLDELEPLLPGVPKLGRSAVEARRATFDASQPLFDATGACHAAMLFAPDGTVLG